MRVHVAFRFKLNPEADFVVANSAGVQQFTAVQAKILMFRARRAFLERVKHTRPVTPPPYAESFRMRKARVGVRKAGGYIIYNVDPAAVMVEFGTHPRGGPTETLGYRPFGRALDGMESGGDRPVYSPRRHRSGIN